jgi:release factor glutamine methyltransferase
VTVGWAEVIERLQAAGCVFAEDEAALLVAAAGSDDELLAMVARRAAGEPLEQVVGWAELGGRRIAVEPGVFVPRRRSELLVRQAIGLAPVGAVVLDLGCGSGALGAVIAAARPDAEVHATDIDPVAVHCARGNFAGPVYHGDLFDPVPDRLRGRFDVIVANVPYVPTGAIALLPAEARRHEPAVALDGGDDGLAVVDRVAAASGPWLAPGGHVLVETSQEQAPGAAAAFATAGLTARVVRDADLDASVVIGRAPPRARGATS